MDKKLVDALNDQIKKELYSSYLYLSMSAYCESINLSGFSQWMQAQAKEELVHTMKIFGFLNGRGEKVVLQAIPQPPADFSSPLNIFEETLKHEKGVTASINKLYKLAREVDDIAAEIFLQWFVTEQVEEESSVTSVLEQLKMVKPDSSGLIMMDRGLGHRQ